MVCTIHRIWEQQLTTATYSASVVDYATKDCFQVDQQTIEDLRKWQVPEVLSDQSHNPQNQHLKSQQDQAKKKNMK
jgi:hypothetical protein